MDTYESIYFTLIILQIDNFYFSHIFYNIFVINFKKRQSKFSKIKGGYHVKTEAETGDIYKPKNTKDYWSSHKARRHREQTHPSEGTCPADPLIPDF